MQVISRRIKFRYFTITAKVLDDKRKLIKEGKINFKELQKTIEDENKIYEKISLKNVEARIEHFELDSNEKNIWKLMMMRLRLDQIPNKAKDSEKAEVINLENDEYIGEDVSLIYDQDTGIAMIQNNRFSLSYNKIQELFNNIYGNDKFIIIIRPILNPERVDIKGKSATKLEISYAMTDDSQINGKYGISDILKKFKSIEGLSGKVSMGIGRTKKKIKSRGGKEEKVNRELDEDEIVNLVKDIESNEDIISYARIHYRDDTTSEISLLDLFDNEFNDYITFAIEPRKNIGFEYITEHMVRVYNKRKVKISSTIAKEGKIKK